jgi:hypothetical protein
MHIRKTSGMRADLELLRNSQISLLLARISFLIAKPPKTKNALGSKASGRISLVAGTRNHLYRTTVQVGSFLG